MDRGGVRDSNVCVGFAFQIQGCAHPACDDLAWHIWDAAQQKHVADERVFATDAPDVLAFIGRRCERENAMVNGKYELRGMGNGRPIYKHVTGALVIWCDVENRRWVISDPSDVGMSNSMAFADDFDLRKPDANLQWKFWEPQSSDFIVDPNAGLVDAPDVVHILGRDLSMEVARINGTYHLAGVNDGRPMYVQPGTQGVIRYSPRNDKWLIDLHGLAHPSLLNRLYQWVLTGDGEDAKDKCSAWAKANSCNHPGQLDLKWNVWESTLGKFIQDEHVMATSAPMTVQVNRRQRGGDNYDIVGEYHFDGIFSQLPFYRKRDTQICLYFSSTGRWVVDAKGIGDTGVCVAFVDGKSGDPTRTHAPWNIFNSERGAFLPDMHMSVVAVEARHDAPSMAFPAAAHCEALPGGSFVAPNPAYHSMKRGYGAEQHFGNQVHAPHAKFARTTNTGGSGWLGIFGA